MMYSKSMVPWFQEQGTFFIKNLGIKKGAVVLDFGCKHGTYTIPTANAIGMNGRVYAIDKDRESLDVLQQTIQKKGYENIIPLQANEQVLHCFPKGFFDDILLFDVIHLIEKRVAFLSLLHSLLKPEGTLFVYPHHHLEHMKMDLADVILEISSVDFMLIQQMNTRLMHDDMIITDELLLFQRK